MAHRRAPSLSLMVADFLTLGQHYEAVLVTLGIDEHRYVRLAQQVRAWLDDGTPLRDAFVLSAADTRMVRGFSGHPKFSKSVPGSAIDVMTPPQEVHRLLIAEPPVPEESATYQLMCQMPHHDAGVLLDLHAYCREAGPPWQRAVKAFTDYVIEANGLWPG